MNKKIYQIKGPIGVNISVDSLITAINQSTLDDLDVLFDILPEARIKANIEADKIIKRVMQ